MVNNNCRLSHYEFFSRLIFSATKIFAGFLFTTSVAHAVCSSGANAICLTTSSVSITANQTVTITGWVTQPPGTIKIMEGSTVLASGGSTFTTTRSFSPGSHTIVASSSLVGDSPSITINVAKAPSTVAASLPKTTFELVEGATVSATISGYKLSGTVDFMVVNDATGDTVISRTASFGNGCQCLASAPVSETVGFPRGGPGHVVVRYNGNDYSAPASFSIPINVNPGNSTTTLTTPVTTVKQDAPIVLTASISGLALTGTVSFYDGTTLLGTVVLPNEVPGTPSVSNATAILSVALHGSGGHFITAVYGGNGSNTPSTSFALKLTVVDPAMLSGILLLLED